MISYDVLCFNEKKTQRSLLKAAAFSISTKYFTKMSKPFSNVVGQLGDRRPDLQADQMRRLVVAHRRPILPLRPRR